MIEKKHVDGICKGNILIYALSTCVWCKRAKKYLDDQGISYDYIDVDLLDKADEEAAKEEIKKQSNQSAFPTIIINNKECIVGFNEDKLREALENASEES